MQNVAYSILQYNRDKHFLVIMSVNNSSFLTPVGLAFLTPSVMVSLMTAKGFSNFLEEMGKASEEVFRGQRLPILKNHSVH